MKFVLMSDLHLEFQGHNPVQFPDADVLVLAGDVLVAEDLRERKGESPGAARVVRYREFLDQATNHYPHVVYVAGNHEFYHGKFYQVLDVLRAEAARYPNLHFLEDAYVDVEDVRFVGGTLWTDCNRQDPHTMLVLQYGMNDYRCITNDQHGYARLRPVHTVQRHQHTREFIAQHITQKTVVVTHHAPSFQSVHSDYAGNGELNGGYASNLEELIINQPQILYWCHGHMHHQFDYCVGSTQVVCNPRGYPGQNPHWSPQVYSV